MSDEEPVSRRDLFSGLARELASGLTEWVLPQDEQPPPEPDSAPDEEHVHPWRDLLMPPGEESEPQPS